MTSHAAPHQVAPRSVEDLCDQIAQAWPAGAAHQRALVKASLEALQPHLDDTGEDLAPANEHPCQREVVYELMAGGSISWWRVGVFTDIDAAKHAASLVLDTYRQFDGDEDTEQTNYDAEWVMKRETIGARHRHEVGDPKPFCVFGSEGSAFKINTITLNEGRAVDVAIYPPPQHTD